MTTNKFESLLELLINEENDKAEALFHEIVVEKSRDIYEGLADEEVTAEAKEENKLRSIYMERWLEHKKKYFSNLPGGIVHCFTGSKSELVSFLDLGLYIGITGWVCDERRGADLNSLLKFIPKDRLIIDKYIQKKS